MRIAMTLHHELVEDAGAPGATLALADAYRRAGHSVRLCSFDDMSSRLGEQGRALLFPWYVAPWLRRAGPLDVIDASSGDTWLWSRMRRARRSHDPVLVMRSHGLEHTVHDALMREVRAGTASVSRRHRLYGGGWRLREVQMTCADADMALFLNDEDRRYAVEHLGAKLERTHLVSNGLPRSLMRLPFRPDGADSIGVAMLGSYVPRKGLAYALPALRNVMRDHSHVSVSLLGTGASRETIVADIPDWESALLDRLSIVPTYARADLPRLLRGHQIALSAAYAEGFGMALLEAMACGLAAVAADAAGPREILSSGAGLLVPSRSARGIEDALRPLVRDTDQRVALQRRSYERAQQYGWDTVTESQLALFSSLRRTAAGDR